MSASLERFAADDAATRSRSLLQAGVLLLILADIVFVVAFVTGVFDTYHWFDEDGPVEDLQAIVLAVAAVFAARHALTQSREGRVISFGLVAMFFASCVRELEFRGTGAPEWLTWLFYGTGQNLLIVTTFAIFAAYSLYRWRETPRAVAAFLTWRTGFYLVAAAVLLISGIAEASEHRFGNPAEVVEEGLELNGYLLFLLAAMFLPYSDRTRAER